MALWPKIRAQLLSRGVHSARAYLDLLRCTGADAGRGVLSLVVPSLKLQHHILDKSTLARDICVAAAQLTGGAWRITWVVKESSAATPRAEGVAHAC